MAKKIVRLDNVAGTKVPSLVKSAKYFNSEGKEATIENGTIVTVKGLLDGEREVHKAVDATPTDALVGIVTTPEMQYEETGYRGLDTYENEAGQVIRVHLLQSGCIFSVTDEAWTKGEELTFGSLKGTCIDIETNGRFTFYVVEIQ